MGIFGSFKAARQTVEDAKKDVRRPKNDEVAQQRAKKSSGQGGGKR